MRRLIPVALLFPVLLAQEPASAPAREFPDDWYWHDRQEQWDKHAPLLGKPLPALDLGEWRNGDAKVLEQAAGKVLVLDFWATWCGPCIKSIPHNHELVAKYGKDGLVFVAVCGSKRGQDQTDAVIEKHKISYPVARDVNLKSAEALAVQWWPTYAVIDRAGKVRAIGLKPESVDAVVEKLLAEKAPAAGAAGADKAGEKAGTGGKDPKGKDPKAGKDGKAGKDPKETSGAGAAGTSGAPMAIAPDWLEKNPQRDTLLAQLTGKPAPALQVTTWANGEAQKLGDFAGKVVLLDFWATWCGPCIASIPHNNELQEKYREQGLVILGICHPKGGEKMGDTVAEKGMKYLSALDESGATIKAYGANSFPDYYFIDRKGVLRVADCNNGAVEQVIEALLAEK